MQLLINLPDCNTSFSSSFFHALGGKECCMPETSTPLSSEHVRHYGKLQSWQNIGLSWVFFINAKTGNTSASPFKAFSPGNWIKVLLCSTPSSCGKKHTQGRLFFGSDVHQTTTEWHEESCRSHDTLQSVSGRSWRFYEKVKFGQIIFIKR